MKKTSVRELHIHTSELVREAEAGQTIVIERRGEPVAELRPFSVQPEVTREQKAQMLARLSKLWAQMPEVSDSTEMISEDRNRS